MPIFFFERSLAFPFAFAVEEKVKNENRGVRRKRSNQGQVYRMVLAKAMKYDHRRGAIAGPDVMQLCLLVVQGTLSDHRVDFRYFNFPAWVNFT